MIAGRRCMKEDTRTRILQIIHNNKKKKKKSLRSEFMHYLLKYRYLVYRNLCQLCFKSKYILLVAFGAKLIRTGPEQSLLYYDRPCSSFQIKIIFVYKILILRVCTAINCDVLQLPLQLSSHCMVFYVDFCYFITISVRFLLEIFLPASILPEHKCDK